MSFNFDRNDFDAARLLRYLTEEDHLTLEEAEEIRTRLQTNPNWRHLMEGLPASAPVDWETEVELKKLEAAMREMSTESPDRTRGRRRRIEQRVRRHHSVRHAFLRVAAVLVMVAFSTLLFVYLQGDGQSESPASDEDVFVTNKGERSILQLTDGTYVRLNVDSRLRVASFSSGVREVWLEGQAYFDVAEDSERPFIVHADPATVQVLGTAFDVSVYSGEPEVRVVVAEGKVSLRSEQFFSRKAVALTRDQMGLLSRGGKRVISAQVDVAKHLAWMEGELVFQDTPFKEVIRKLERWYDLDIERPEFVAGHLNARFAEQQPVNEVLHIVATAFGLTYECEGKTITFLPVVSSSS